MNGRKWTEEELELLRNEYRTGNIIELSRKIGRSYNAVMNKANQIGLVSGRRITDKERRLFDKYEQFDHEFLAKKTGRSYNSIKNMRKRHGYETIINANYDSMCMLEASRTLGIVAKRLLNNLNKHGYKTIRVGRYRMVKIDDLIDFVRMTDLCDPLKVDESFVELTNAEWFVKRKEDAIRKLRNERWGEWYGYG